MNEIDTCNFEVLWDARTRNANIEVAELLHAQHVLPELPAASQSLSLWSSLCQATTNSCATDC